MRFIPVLAVVVFSICCAIASGSSKPGTVDRGFGSHGKVTLGPEDGADDVGVQHSGKIVTVGYSNDGATVVRFSRDGSLDRSFGEEGRAALPSSIANDFDALAVDGADRIVAVGQSEGGDVLVARFRASGAPDSSFSGDGVTTKAIGRNSFATDVAISDGSEVVVVGSTTKARSRSRMLVARFQTNGTPDHGFDDDGVRKLVGYSEGHSIVANAGGEVTVGGATDKGALFTRLRRSGEYDRAFGSNGHTVLPSKGFVSRNQIAGKGGSILAALTVDEPGSGGRASNIVLTKLNGKGSIDKSFADGGRKTLDLMKLDIVQGIVIGPGSKPTVLTNARPKRNPAHADFALLRFSSDGSADKGFSDNGRAFARLTNPGGSSAYASGLAIQSGRYVVSGGFVPSNGGDRLAVTRLFG